MELLCQSRRMADTLHYAGGRIQLLDMWLVSQLRQRAL